jgi:glutamate synthase (NADPH) small chain
MGVEFVLNTESGATSLRELLATTTRCSSAWAPTPTCAAVSRARICPVCTRPCPTWSPTSTARHGLERTSGEFIDMQGKRVVVLGGGDTGMDCVRTATRQGASVTCAYRRDEANMPGSARGGERQGGRRAVPVQRQPVEIVGETAPGRGREGRRDPPRRSPDEAAGAGRKPVPGTEEGAPGRRGDHRLRFPAESRPTGSPSSGIETADPGGRVLAPERGASPSRPPIEKVFAGGDMVRGSDLVVTAVFEGQRGRERHRAGLLRRSPLRRDSGMPRTITSSIWRRIRPGIAGPGVPGCDLGLLGRADHPRDFDAGEVPCAVAGNCARMVTPLSSSRLVADTVPPWKRTIRATM